MRRRSLIIKLGVLPFLAVVSAIPSTAPAQAEVRGLVVTVAPDNPLKDVSSAELRKLFMRGSESIQGQPLVPLNHTPNTPIRAKFDRVILGMSEAEVGRYWIDRRLRGQSGPPRSADSPQLLKRVVARLKGAITYLPVEQLDGSVRALSIDGVPYNDARYGLR